MVSCYTHRAINSIAAKDMDILERINKHPDFWRVNSFSLQTTLFIVLARILDHDPGVHSIYQVLNATTAHPEFFSKAALRARKLGMPGGQWDMAVLDEYVQNAWEPTVQDLRMLKKALAPHKTKFDAIYKPLRDQVYAHTVLKDEVFRMIFPEEPIPPQKVMWADEMTIEGVARHMHIASRKNRKMPGEDPGDDYTEGFRGLKMIGYNDYVSLECGSVGDRTVTIPAAAKLLKSQWEKA